MAHQTAQHPSTSQRIIRKLADIELYHTATHLLGQYVGTVLSVTYIIPSPQPQARFEAAIAQTILQHPILQVAITGEDSPDPSFVQLSSVNLRHHITWRSPLASSKEQVLQEQLDTKFTRLDTTPGWRIVILAQEEGTLDVLFAWNHAICDGISGKAFHESLLAHLNSATPSSADLHDGTLNLPPIRAFPPPATSAKFPLGPRYLITALWDEYKPPALAHPARWAPVRPSPYKTALRSLKLAAGLLQGVLSACRNHGTTLTGLLHALALVSLATSVPPREAAGFRSETALDMRRFVQGAGAALAMGNLYSSTHHCFGRRATSRLRERIKRAGGNSGRRKAMLAETVWTVARQVRREIQTALDKGTRDNILGLMRFVKDWRRQMAKYVGKPRMIGWAVTNLGVLDGEPVRDEERTCAGERWRVGEARFTLSAQASGAAISISVISVKGASLCMDVSWQDGLVDALIVEKLVTDLGEWLEYLATV
ncbi:Alcohol acetyltransferase [Metarhizium brunneum]